MQYLFQYQIKSEPVFTGPETPQIDKWFAPLDVPKRIARGIAFAAALAASGNFFASEPIVAAEIVTVDKWFQNLSIPADTRRSIKPAAQISFVTDTASLLSPEAPQLDKWHAPLSLPSGKAGARLPSYYSFVALDVAAPETVTFDKWFAEWRLPVIARVHPHTYNYSVDALTQPEATQLDKWFSALSNPPQTQVSAQYILQDAPLTAALPVETISMDKWHASLSEPLRPNPGLRAALSFTFSADTTTPVITLTYAVEISVPAEPRSFKIPAEPRSFKIGDM